LLHYPKNIQGKSYSGCSPEKEEEFAEKVLTIYNAPSLAEEKLENARRNISKNLSWDKEK
jgi:glycosyltransferase involved in cell wall biosynthesis